MRDLTYTELRRELKRALDDVSDSREPIRITRRNGRSAVLVAEEDFTSLLETQYLLRSPANAARLMDALTQSRTGRGRHVDPNALLYGRGAR